MAVSEPAPSASRGPRVSVIIPSYNSDAFIHATVESVLAQTYEDFEVVIADHSSTDGTRQVLQEFAHDPRVRLLTTPAGGGVPRNWKRVTDEARGELVKLVCGDDLLTPDCLATQVAAFDAHDDRAVMVASPRDIVDASGRLVVRNLGLAGLTGRIEGRAAIRRSVIRGTNIFGEPCCVMMRRATLQAVGGWQGDGYMIDQATYCRVLLTGDLVATAGPLAVFRLSSTQWSMHLAREQARSAAALHRQIAGLSPGILTRWEVALGNAMAALRSAQRRLLYLYLGRRLRPD